MSLIKYGYGLEHKTCDVSAAERLQLMRFDNRLIICIDSLKNAVLYMTQLQMFQKVEYG